MYLGIDVGTGKTAVVLVNDEGGAVAVFSLPHCADRKTPRGRSEQDPRILLDSVVSAMKGMTARELVSIRGIGITGQMHGVLILDSGGEPVTPLFTWQDARTLEGDFLDQLSRRVGRRLSAGYGCVTLAWLAANGGVPREAAAASTVQDFIAMKLCGLPRPVTDPTDGASWGLFDLETLSWDAFAVKAAGIPADLMPDVVPCGKAIGLSRPPLSEAMGIPSGIPVVAALGDCQASLLATLREPEEELALTLGTGGQLSAILPIGAPREELPLDGACEYRPFPGGRFIATSAALCGGSAWAWLAATLQGWIESLGLPAVPRERIFAAMNELGLKAADGPQILPHFLGERSDPELRASIQGIGLDNFSLGEVARALATGICANLRDMLPESLRRGRSRVMAGGNALSRNPLLLKAAERVFGVPVVLSGGKEDAAVGAALFAARSVAP